jgi:hypothetical protein
MVGTPRMGDPSTGDSGFTRYQKSLKATLSKKAQALTISSSRNHGSRARAVRPRDDLEEMAARILEIDTTAAVVSVDRSWLLLKRIGPIR